LQSLYDGTGDLIPSLQAETAGDTGPDLGMRTVLEIVAETGRKSFIVDPRQEAQQHVHQMGVRF
jgi:hypothetical protein|tara:strand:- start:298 stop:489 length:192 start_codon:yes stop_codon:yes gene_type:complete